jgi:hypothetical protein
MTSSSAAHPTVTSRRGHGGVIFVIAMGLALATSGGAVLSAVGTGALQHTIQQIGWFRSADIIAEQRRQSETVAQLEDSLYTLMGEVAMLKSRDLTAKLDIEEHLARLDSGLARIGLDAETLRIARPDAGASNHDVDELRTNLTMAGIEISALRTSLDATQQAQQREFGTIAKRVERLERIVGDPDLTSSITTRRPHEGVPGWSVRDAQHGAAFITGNGITYRVKPGSIVPGIGRILSVRARGDRWIVATEKGAIVQQ